MQQISSQSDNQPIDKLFGDQSIDQSTNKSIVRSIRVMVFDTHLGFFSQ